MNFTNIKAIVTDIEGTTTSLSFVKDVLFPYADTHMQAFAEKHQADPCVMGQLEAVRRQSGHPEFSLPDIVAQLRQWIAEDKKVTPLKAIQGMLWEEGYKNGDFTGHVYDDAVRNLRAWHEQGLKLYVYSSGSTHAQKLLFGYSDAGDLMDLFSGYFDTQIGHKRETAAYARILSTLECSAAQILFLSDIPEELDAARQVGLQTCCLIRENQPTSGLQHPWVTDFDKIILS